MMADAIPKRPYPEILTRDTVYVRYITMSTVNRNVTEVDFLLFWKDPNV